MKLKLDRQYLKVVFYVVLTIVLIYLSYVFLHNFGKIAEAVGRGFAVTLNVFSPLIIGFIIAYLFDPVVEFFQVKYEEYRNKNGKPVSKSPRSRKFGTSLLFVLFFSILGGLITVGTKGLITAVESSDSVTFLITDYVEDFNKMFANLQTLFEKIGMWDYVSTAIVSISNSLMSLVADVSKMLINLVVSSGSLALTIFISIVVSFYFLMEKEFAKAKIDDIMTTISTRKITRIINNFFGDINAVFSGYIRGQMTDALIMSCLITLALFVMKVKFPLVIGIISGFSNLIPYFGAMIGLLLAVLVTLLEGEFSKAILVVIVILIIQQIDSTFINPKVVGKNVDVHPVVVLMAITAAGELFGLWGMVVAVPVVATVKLFAVRILERRKLEKQGTE